MPLAVPYVPRVVTWRTRKNIGLGIQKHRRLEYIGIWKMIQNIDLEELIKRKAWASNYIFGFFFLQLKIKAVLTGA